MAGSFHQVSKHHVLTGKPYRHDAGLLALLASNQHWLCWLRQQTVDFLITSMGHFLPNCKSTPSTKNLIILLYTLAEKAPLIINYIEPQTNHQVVHTNNYTKLWHQLLKTSYLNTLEQLQINNVVQILTDEVESHYRWAQLQVEGGFAGQTTKQFQQRAKLLAEAFTVEELQLLGIVCSKNPTGVRASLHCKTDRPGSTNIVGIAICIQFTISSFTHPMSKLYWVTVKAPVGISKGQVTNCSCAHYTHYGSACKHMFHLAKMHDLHIVEDTSIDTLDSDKEDTLPTHKEVEAFSACSVVDLNNDKLSNAAISIDDSTDSDVEIVHLIISFGKTKSDYRPPTQSKRSNDRPVSPATNPKRH
jgi:hypothetical protein